jgi:hypothetical protein
MHPHETMFRAYVEGDASASDRERVDEHLKACGECRELLSFIQDFSRVAKDTEPGDIAPEEPCYPTEAVVAYEHEELDRATALKLRKHMLTCDRCAETYYLIKRMRAPSWTEVVIEAVQSAKESLLRPLEVIGMGELVPLPATVHRGDEDAGEAQPRVDIAQAVSDSGGKAQVLFSLEADVEGPGATVRIRIGIDTAMPAWRANLLADEEKIASVPLGERKQLLHASLIPGTYTVQIVKNGEVLAECRLKIQAAHEPTASHRDR